jgi:phosphatidylglycerol:prolipoprotein diacylglycerol transferase
VSPYIFDVVPAYFTMWGLAAVVCIGLGVFLAVRHEYPVGRSIVALLSFALLILIGSKLLYLVEAALFPLDDYVPPGMRGLLHGFRIPGGILLLAVGLPLTSHILGLPWLRFGDTLIPLAALALVFIRAGCFLNGCCFGRTADLPWAISFPLGSWVFWYHHTHDSLPSGAIVSLSVHPLQLYFLCTALAIFLILLRISVDPPGHRQLVFYLLFFGSTALLEPFRANYLTLNNWLAPTAMLIALVAFTAHAYTHRRLVPKT